MTNAILSAALNRLLDGRATSLIQAMGQAHAFKLATGRVARQLLSEIVPESQWVGLGRDDAIAALELALSL